MHTNELFFLFIEDFVRLPETPSENQGGETSPRKMLVTW